MSDGPEFCDQCFGPYEGWPGTQYNGHSDTCINRHNKESTMYEPSHIIMTDGTLVTKDGIEYVPKTRATKDTTDGHPTFRELYYYRMLYNAQAATAWLLNGITVVKSWNHHDGEPCFDGGMFVVQAELPTGQVSNHYKAEFWPLFNVQAVDIPAEWDGHTPEIAAVRMHQYLEQAADKQLF